MPTRPNKGVVGNVAPTRIIIMTTVIHPSPSLTANEEDIAGRSIPFDEQDDFIAASPRGLAKGKAREINSGSSTPDASTEQLEDAGYPPTSEDAAETRRIEEVFGSS